MTTQTAPAATTPRPTSGDGHRAPAHEGLRRTLAQRVGLDLVYVLLGFPVALASFVAMVTMLSVSVSLLIIIVGLPLLALTVYVARGFAILERTRLRGRGDDLAPVVYRHASPDSGWFARLFTPLRDPQSWLDVAHALVAFPVALATWVVAVTLTAAAALGCTFVLWAPFIDSGDNENLAELAGLNVSDYIVNPVVGFAALVALVPVTRLLAEGQAAIARTMLCNARVAALQSRVATLTASRAAAAAADVGDRRRLERDIHDGPQQRLVRLGMDLASAERRLDDDPDAARRLLAEAREHSRAALDELRALSRGIAPPVLADRGLNAALSDAAARCPVPVTLYVRLLTPRLPEQVENAVYFTVAEALTNVAKHADASHVDVRVEPDSTGRAVVVRIVDDGVGGADLGRGHGLAGLRDRLGLLDGTIEVTSPAGGPTTVRAEVPCGY